MREYRFFEVTPRTGRMQPFQTTIVRVKYENAAMKGRNNHFGAVFRFRPHKCARYTKNYAVCMLKIVKINARENVPQGKRSIKGNKVIESRLSDDLTTNSTYSMTEQPLRNFFLIAL